MDMRDVMDMTNKKSLRTSLTYCM